MNHTRSPGLPSFSGLSEAREGGNNGASNAANNNHDGAAGDSRGTTRRESQETNKRRLAPAPSVSDGPSAQAFDRMSTILTKSFVPHVHGHGGSSSGPGSATSSSHVLLQDTLTPLLDEVDILFEKSKQIVASFKAQGNQLQDDDVSMLCCSCCTVTYLAVLSYCRDVVSCVLSCLGRCRHRFIFLWAIRGESSCRCFSATWLRL